MPFPSAARRSQSQSPRAARRPRVDRGPRPLLRGWLHSGAAVVAAIVSVVFTIMAARCATLPVVLATVVYGLCLTGSMTVSALYHRGPWHSERTVRRWRRADHAMIAVFIAGTYGPIVTALVSTTLASWVLAAAWAGACAAVILSVVWVEHPRWLAVGVYLFLGWLSLVILRPLWQADPTIVWLLASGGLVYSLGAVVYGLKRPNPSERWFGFHEVFHAATLVAAALHAVAVGLAITS